VAYLLHIATRRDWEAALARGHYQADSLAAEGFIHCSTQPQVDATGRRFYAGRDDLVLLTIDPARLGAEVRFERAPDVDERFPHVYGIIELDAVVAAHDWTPAA
jgi:uncharacterized protein (DUF952 family)